MIVSAGIEAIKEMIADPQIKCVSFDLFDTLLQRPVVEPADIFMLVGQVCGIAFFKQRRIAAEKRALLFKDFYKATTNINAIYKSYALMFDATPEETEKIKETELKIEAQLSYQRKAGKTLYDYAVSLGKKVVVASNMYLPAHFLKEILERNGYEEILKVYVSCEENAIKNNGALYKKIALDLKDLGIWSNNILHIGDNLKVDVQAAAKMGLGSAHIPAAVSVFKQGALLKKQLKWESSVFEGHHKLMAGLLANMMFDDPFKPFDLESRYNGEAKSLGHLIAPFFVSFALWLARQALDDGIARLALVWRDGWLIEEIFNILRPHLSAPLPEFERIYLSRACRYPFFSRHRGGMFDAIFQWNMDSKANLMQFINKRLFLTDEEDIKAALKIFARHGYRSAYQAIGARDGFAWFLHEFEPLYRKGAEEQIKLCSEHLAPLKTADVKLGVFDIGYTGTVSRFLYDFHDIRSDGYFLLGTSRLNEEYKGGRLKAYVEYGHYLISQTKKILHDFMEMLLCEQTPSIVGFKRGDNGRLETVQDPDFQPNETIAKIQEGILEYARQFAELFQGEINALNIDRHYFWATVIEILTAPNLLDADMLKPISLSVSAFRKPANAFEFWHQSHFNELTKEVT